MNYWGQKEDIAIKKFVETTDIEIRNAIYVKELHLPCQLMIKGVLFGKHFKRLPIEIKNELFDECQSFIYETLSKFKPELEKKAFNYLTTCILNFIRDKHLKQTKLKSIFPDFEVYNTEEIDESDETVDIKEIMIQQIMNALPILEEYERIIFDMYFLQQKTQNEIAEKVGVGSASIYKIIREIRIKIKTEVGATKVMHRIYGERKPNPNQININKTVCEAEK